MTTIIGVLAAALVPKLSSAKERAVNAKILKETTDVANAIDLYYQDFSTYPVASTCNGVIKTDCSLSGVASILRSYISSMPA